MNGSGADSLGSVGPCSARGGAPRGSAALFVPCQAEPDSETRDRSLESPDFQRAEPSGHGVNLVVLKFKGSEKEMGEKGKSKRTMGCNINMFYLSKPQKFYD